VGDDLLPEILGQTDPVASETLILNLYPLVAASEKSSIMTNKKSTTGFPMSLRLIAYVACKPPPPTQRGLKTQNGHFLSKIALVVKKVCYKVYFCENCQRQSCKVLTGLSIRAELLVDVPFYT